MAQPTAGATIAAGTSLQNPQGTGQLWADGLVAGQGANYVLAGGAANALTVTLTTINPGVLVTVGQGLQLIVKTRFALQVGANTLNVNAHGADSIVNINGHNIKSVINIGAIMNMVFDGTNWVILNPTY